MRHRLTLPKRPLQDTLEFVAYLVPLCVIAYGLWYWSGIGAPWEVKAAGYLTAFFGLLNLSLLSIRHTLRLLKEVLAEIRRLP